MPSSQHQLRITRVGRRRVRAGKQSNVSDEVVIVCLRRMPACRLIRLHTRPRRLFEPIAATTRAELEAIHRIARPFQLLSGSDFDDIKSVLPMCYRRPLTRLSVMAMLLST